MAVTSAVSAQSLFPLLSTPTPAPPEPDDLAPSYSGFANVKPDKEEQYGEDGTLQTYEGVTEASYNEFGKYLERFGFENTATNINGRSVEMILDNGVFNIGIIYDAENKKLQMVFQDGVNYEKKDYFKNYIRVNVGEKIKIDTGEIIINDIKIKSGFLFANNRYLTDWWWKIEDQELLDSYILFDFKNTKNYPIKFYSTKYKYDWKNDLASFKLIYITDTESEFIYDLDYFGKIVNIGGKDRLLYGELAGSYDNDSARWKLDPLMWYSLGGGFKNLPTELKISENSSLALIIDNKYAIVLRENGITNVEW